MEMKQHVTIVGALHIGCGVLGLFAAAVVFVATVGGGLLSGDAEAIRITGIVGTLVAGLIGVLSMPGIVGGIGLLRRWSWARILVLVLSVFDLAGVPIGTLLGIYSIWVLMQDETAKMFGPCC